MDDYQIIRKDCAMTIKWHGQKNMVLHLVALVEQDSKWMDHIFHRNDQTIQVIYGYSLEKDAVLSSLDNYNLQI